ncbi:BMP family ABC transporter substrate-binding protein [Chloroflexi bacterium TSY]|nr:BMP family ABC transporter substrate-binding protein [Chloroflexi bacterium TSY]
MFTLALVACLAPVVAPTRSEGNAEAAKMSGDEMSAVGSGGSAIGFLFVGQRDDLGHNQAAYIGSEAVEAAFKQYEMLRAENVPENQEAERVMEDMIRNGAKIIFPTSYGHLDPALAVAERHPDVVFLHLAGFKTAENLGTYFGTVWETVYLSGVAAGHMSKTGKLGYVASFPIPPVLLNINAFTLGAQSVNPDITTTVVFTESWCSPDRQAEAANSLIAQDVDVVTQHQDCTKTVIETVERAGAMSVGYHVDASELAPKGWITGSIWNWGDLYVEIINSVESGAWADSPFTGTYRTGVAEGTVQLAPFGPSVPQEVQDEVLALQAQILDGSFFPFEGPVYDQDGGVRIAEDVRPSVEELEATDYLIQGVIGTIPK